MKHFMCEKCGTIITTVNFSGNPISCCKEKMEELVPNTKEASVEKHSPRIKVRGKTVTVTVGEDSNMHPQTKEHRVEWVCLVTDHGTQRKMLPEDGEPVVSFGLTDGEKVIKAFAFCNLHGVWMSKAAE